MKKINNKQSGEEREARVPTDLGSALTAAPKVRAKWDHLTPLARYDFISWIDSAKQPETRKRRVAKAGSMLIAGKRRPCCYAIVPMNFYKALNGTPRAKAVWSGLTPIERRGFVSWVESAKEPEARGLRIEKACLMLAAGKRRP